jgi:hypothetical protein
MFIKLVSENKRNKFSFNFVSLCLWNTEQGIVSTVNVTHLLQTVGLFLLQFPCKERDL